MESFEQTSQPSPADLVKKLIGLVLTILGATIGLWIVSVAYDLLVNAEQIRLINIITQELDRTVRTASGELELPAGVFVAGGYLLVCVLLSICAGIAKTFLSLGVRLLQGDIKALVSKLARELKGSVRANSTAPRSRGIDQGPGGEPR